MLHCPSVLEGGLRVAPRELAKNNVEETSPRLWATFDQQQVLGPEEHRSEPTQKLSGLNQLTALAQLPHPALAAI